MSNPKSDPRITKRKVTMRSSPGFGGTGLAEFAEDFVREDFLDAYVADAKTKWESVEVSEGYDAGPAGYDGATYIPAHLDVPNAGMTFPATEA